MSVINSTKDFILVPPIMLSASDMESYPPSSTNKVYDGLTSYSIGDQVWYSGKNYRSRVNGNLGNTPDSSPTEWSDEGEVDFGADEWDNTISYGESTDQNPVHVTRSNKVFESAIASNLNNDPLANDGNWTEVGYTNNLKAFDGFISDGAQGKTSIVWEINLPSRIDQVALIRPIGSNVKITMTNTSDGVVYPETSFPIVRNSRGGLYNYFFSPIRRVGSVIKEMPPYSLNTVLRVEIIAAEGAEVGVGQILIGFSRRLASVLSGTGVGITSYSKKDRDAFNRAIITSRPFSNRVAFKLVLDQSEVDEVNEILAERESLATLYFMKDGDGFGTVVYGYFKDFFISHNDPPTSTWTLDIEGLG